jgi:lipopolysaccharide/colanic/teichoic acid biosynthesis glycosyltransferase
VSSTVSSQAYVLGPVLIGANCTVEPHAQIIGPAVIGDGCVIEEGGLVRESVLWSGSTIARGSRAEYSVIGSGYCVPSGTRLKECIVMNDRTPVEQILRPAAARAPRMQSRPGARLSAPRSVFGALLKRAIDIFGASQGLVLFSPLFVAIAVAIKLDSAGPVLFSQQRCGRGGWPFRMLKFRTMVVNAERLQKHLAGNKDVDGPVFKVFKDPRVTRVGRLLRKLSLDELPQLWNVLAGDMSLVGPRPLVMGEMRFSPSWRDLRLSIKPGITGPWQIGGRNHASFHDWILKDVSYVRTHSVWQDLMILMKTIFWAFGRLGGY